MYYQNNYYLQTVYTGYHIMSDLNDVLKSGYYEFPLGCNNVNWFVDGFFLRKH